MAARFRHQAGHGRPEMRSRKEAPGSAEGSGRRHPAPSAPGPSCPPPSRLQERRLCPAQCVPRLVVLWPPPACYAPQDPLPARWEDGGRVGRSPLSPCIHFALGLGREMFSGAKVLALRLLCLLFGESWGPLSGAAMAEPPLRRPAGAQRKADCGSHHERPISGLCTLLATRPCRVPPVPALGSPSAVGG